MSDEGWPTNDPTAITCSSIGMQQAKAEFDRMFRKATTITWADRWDITLNVWGDVCSVEFKWMCHVRLGYRTHHYRSCVGRWIPTETWYVQWLINNYPFISSLHSLVHSYFHYDTCSLFVRTRIPWLNSNITERCLSSCASCVTKYSHMCVRVYVFSVRIAARSTHTIAIHELAWFRCHCVMLMVIHRCHSSLQPPKRRCHRHQRHDHPLNQQQQRSMWTRLVLLVCASIPSQPYR